MKDQILKYGTLLNLSGECCSHPQKPTDGIGVLRSHMSGGYTCGSGWGRLHLNPGRPLTIHLWPWGSDSTCLRLSFPAGGEAWSGLCIWSPPSSTGHTVSFMSTTVLFTSSESPLACDLGFSYTICHSSSHYWYLCSVGCSNNQYADIYWALTLAKSWARYFTQFSSSSPWSRQEVGGVILISPRRTMGQRGRAQGWTVVN